MLESIVKLMLDYLCDEEIITLGLIIEEYSGLFNVPEKHKERCLWIQIEKLEINGVLGIKTHAAINVYVANRIDGFN